VRDYRVREWSESEFGVYTEEIHKDPPPPSQFVIHTLVKARNTLQAEGLGAYRQGQRVVPRCGLAVNRCSLTAEDRLVLHRNPYGFVVDQVAGTWIRFDVEYIYGFV